MSTTNSENPQETPRPRSHTGILWMLFIGMALALAGNVYQFNKSDRLSHDLMASQRNTETQIAKLTDAATTALQQTQQRFDQLEGELRDQVRASTTAAVKQARYESKKNSSQLQQAFEQKQQDVVQQLSDLQQETSARLSDLKQDTSSQLTGLKQDTDTKIDKVSTDLAKAGADLKRVMGDMGVMSGLVATNGKQLDELRQLGERNYFEFDLTKANQPQRVGDIRLLLKKADPKHNRYTLEVMADDKKVEKKDKTINEPVQLYVSGGHQPYEIVVNQVKKNEVVGYLAVPKVKPQRNQAG
ncbi:MAG TPA: hypothetical protein VMB25_26490 [Bryobacteraceae bacterium]|nr:hypothetical protein [Bryobacteraceae bacterium]